MALVRYGSHAFVRNAEFSCINRGYCFNSRICLNHYRTVFLVHYRHDGQHPVLCNVHSPSILKPFSRRRQLFLSAINPDKSKLEESLKEKKKQKQVTSTNPASIAGAPVVENVSDTKVQKKPLLTRFWAEVVHYYHGFRLLALDVRIAAKTMWKILNGKAVVRRERNQFRRAVSDIFRLAPFSVFIIIPFAEVALPFAVKLFPNMLPSTFESSSSRDLRLKRELKVKLEMAKFLQDTVEDIAVRTKKSSKKSEATQNFVTFIQKVRNENEQPTNEEILKHAKLFEDQLTLANMSRKQLIALCRLISVPAVGNNELLRFLIQMKVNQLHSDDLMIQQEGIDSLTTAELVTACQARGMRALGVPRARLKQQLAEWVDLHIVHDVPNSLLLLSRVLYVSETVPVEAKLKEAISTLPEKAAGEAEVRAAELNLERVDNTTRYKAAKLEHEEIVEEAAKASEKQKFEGDAETIKRKQETVSESKRQVDAVPSDTESDIEARVDDDVLVDNARIICDDNKITQQEIDAIDSAMEQISADTQEIQSVKSDLEDLREDVKEYQIDVTSLNDELKVEDDEFVNADTKASKRLQKRIGKLIGNMESMVTNLDKESVAEDTGLNIVSVKELIKSVQSLETIPDEKLQKVFEILDTNKDGHVDVNEARQVIKLLNEEDVEVTHNQLQHIVKVLTGSFGTTKIVDKP